MYICSLRVLARCGVTQSKSILIFIILIHCGNKQWDVCSVNWKFERRWSFSMNSMDFFLPTCCPSQLLIFCARQRQSRFFFSARHLSSRVCVCVRGARARSPFFEFLIFFTASNSFFPLSLSLPHPNIAFMERVYGQVALIHTYMS